MMLLLTGQPGHGKTAYGLVRARELVKEGREVYAHGVKDLDYDRIGFKRLDDPKEWEALPDRSVVLIDECYSTFPNRNAASKVPEHVEAMARHRHRGFDFILIAQQGLQLDPFLRGLYDEHIHVRRQWGTRKTNLRRWDKYQGNVGAHCGDIQTWIRPNDIFQFYTSTTFDTTKRRIPTWAKYLLGTAVFFAILLYILKLSYSSKIETLSAMGTTSSASMLSGGTPSGSGGGSPDSNAPKWESLDAYLSDHSPRIVAMPWTAPVYDQRAAIAEPELYCMASEPGIGGNGEYAEGGCTCLTEQGTRYRLQMKQCRQIARNGVPYNPYRRQQPQMAAPAPVAPVDQAPVTRVPPTSAPGPGQALGFAEVAGYGQFGLPTPDYETRDF